MTEKWSTALRELWTRAWPWGVLVAVMLVLRFWFDLFVPREEWALRVLKQALIAVCLLAGSHATWRSGRIRTGVLIAFAAGTIGAALGVAGYGAILAIRHDPAVQASLYEGGDLQEGLAAALAMPWMGAVLGLVGAAVTRLLAKRRIAAGRGSA
jgi:uncharacterized membrane protein YeaQ/YmgE (transglycosylase-associated protein family)